MINTTPGIAMLYAVAMNALAKREVQLAKSLGFTVVKGTKHYKVYDRGAKLVAVIGKRPSESGRGSANLRATLLRASKAASHHQA